MGWRNVNNQGRSVNHLNKVNLVKIFKFWFPVFVYFVIIYVISAQPNLSIPVVGGRFDKITHVIEYAPLGFLLYRAFLGTTNISSYKRLIFLSIFIGTLYGVSDEYHQSFVPGRHAGVGDVIADGIGATLGGIIAFFFYKRRKDME